MAENMSDSALDNSSLSCDLTGLPSFILQFVLGCVAFSTLILKRLREPASTRRPVFIWLADSVKQGIGMLGAHFCNLLLAQLLPVQVKDHCILYLLNFLLDSTFGILIIYVLFKIMKVIVNHWNILPLKTGEYGDPFRFHYWLAQCGVVLLIMLMMKLIIGPFMLFKFWEKVGKFLLPFHNKELRTAVVIFIVPFIVNVVMFWIVDSIIMRSSNGSKNSKSNSLTCCTKRRNPVVKFQRKHQTIYLPLSNGEIADIEEEEEEIPTDSNDTRE